MVSQADRIHALYRAQQPVVSKIGSIHAFYRVQHPVVSLKLVWIIYRTQNYMVYMVV